MGAARAGDRLIVSAPTRRHLPAIEALFAAVAVLVDDTPTGTCMLAGCLHRVDHTSPSTWFCSQQHSVDWLVLANGGTTVLRSRLTMAEQLAESHAASPACPCGCIELCVALEVAADEDAGLYPNADRTLASKRFELEQYARDLAELRGRHIRRLAVALDIPSEVLEVARPGVVRHPNGLPLTAASFELDGLAARVEHRVLQIFRELRGKDDGPVGRVAPDAPPPAHVNCRSVVGIIDRAAAIDFAAVPLPAGNRRARRRWRRFWQAMLPETLFARRPL